MKTFLLAAAFALGLSSAALADDQWPQPRATAVATYDCPPGPGYLMFTVIDANQAASRVNLWVGSREICDQQRVKLYENRSTFNALTLVAICAGQDDVYYLKRWSIDPWGRHQYQGQIYYGPLPDCLIEADRTNLIP